MVLFRDRLEHVLGELDVSVLKLTVRVSICWISLDL